MRLANEGVQRLSSCVDTMIVIPNQNLFQLVDPSTSLMDSFSLADDVLLAGVKSITDLMTNPGLINLDFADVQSVMSGMGNAMLGTGQAEGEGRALKAAEQALCNPLLGSVGVKSAKGMLVNITGGRDMTLFEVDAAAQVRWGGKAMATKARPRILLTHKHTHTHTLIASPPLPPF